MALLRVIATYHGTCAKTEPLKFWSQAICGKIMGLEHPDVAQRLSARAGVRKKVSPQFYIAVRLQSIC